MKIAQKNSFEISPEMSQRAYLNILEDMQGEKQAMEDQRIATFNIMEDITDAQEELKKRYTDLDTLKELVQNLGNSLKIPVIMQQLTSALYRALPESVNISYVIPSSDPGKPSNIVYVHAQTTIGNAYLNAIKEHITSSCMSLPSTTPASKRLPEWIAGKFLFEFVEGERGGDEAGEPGSIFSLPLLVNDDVLGIVNVSSSKSGLFGKQEIELVNTMISATASTMSRLRQLVDSEQSRIQSLVESLSNGVIMFDLDQKVNMSNNAAQLMTGLPREGFYLSEFTKLFTSTATEKELLMSFEEKVVETLQTGIPTHVEEAHVSRFSYEVFITPIHDNEKKVIGGAIIVHDITHIKEIDRMKTEFVSIASHQLRTPMTSINWNLEMLMDGDAGQLTSAQLEYLNEVTTSSKRMVKLINDLLNVSRLETGRLKIEPEETDLVLFIEESIKEVEPLIANKKCTIHFDHEKKSEMLLVDQTLFRQVLRNFLTNAIRYSSNDNTCSIVITLSRNEKEYIIAVKDSGIGIPKDQQVRVFEKFYRADNARVEAAEGSGLGMYLAKMILESSGGRLWFESAGEGKGTTFFVAIPESGMKEKDGEKGLS